MKAWQGDDNITGWQHDKEMTTWQRDDNMTRREQQDKVKRTQQGDDKMISATPLNDQSITLVSFDISLFLYVCNNS